MASLMRRLEAFARSPQGRRLAEQARRAGQDPRNRRRLQELQARLMQRGGGFLGGSGGGRPRRPY